MRQAGFRDSLIDGYMNGADRAAVELGDSANGRDARGPGAVHQRHGGFAMTDFVFCFEGVRNLGGHSIQVDAVLYLTAWRTATRVLGWWRPECRLDAVDGPHGSDDNGSREGTSVGIVLDGS